MTKLIGRDSRVESWYLTIIIVVIAFALRVYRLDAQSIWWDEGHSIQMSSAALSQIPTLPGMDVHPPGYFVLLHGWMALAGRSEFALRYLSVAFSMLTVALLIRFGQELAGRLTGWVAGGLAALSPLYVTYAQEVRMYATVTFLALASVYFLWRSLATWEIGREDWKPLVGYVLVTAASLYTHYFTIFLLLFENIVWLVWALGPRTEAGTRRRRISIWLGAQLAILIIFLPQLRLALRQTVAYANPSLTPPGVAEFISRSWTTYTLGTAIDSAVVPWLGWALALILALVLLFRILKARQGGRDGRLDILGFLAGWFLIPLAAYFLVVQRRPSFEPRYMMLVTPALMLLLAWGLSAVRHEEIGAGHQRLWLGGLGFLAFLTFFGMGTWFYFTNTQAHKDDSAGLVAWLAAKTTPDDVVYVDVPHPFHYYADRIPAPTRYLFVDIHTAADVLNSEASGRDRLFWVTWWRSDTDPRAIIPFLLDKAALRLGELEFRGYRVTWWDLPGDAHFSLPADLSQVDFIFGDVVHLDGLAFSDVVQAGKSAWATLHFSLLRQTDADYRVSLRLRDPDGNVLSSTDRDLLNDRHFHTSAWPVDDPRLNQAINVYMLPLPPDTSPGDYCLEVVVYGEDTLEALPVVGVSSSECVSTAQDGISAQVGRVDVSP